MVTTIQDEEGQIVIYGIKHEEMQQAALDIMEYAADFSAAGYIVSFPQLIMTG